MWGESWIILYRTIVLYFLVLFIMRLMGKRSVGNMAPFDLAVVIMIGSTAAIPIEEIKEVSLVEGMVATGTLALLQIALTLINLHSSKIENISQGVPTLLVKDGKIMNENLIKERVTMADLLMTLRENQISNLSDVKELWLEPDGRISVFKADKAQPITKQDLENVTSTAIGLIAAQHKKRLEKAVSQIIGPRVS